MANPIKWIDKSMDFFILKREKAHLSDDLKTTERDLKIEKETLNRKDRIEALKDRIKNRKYDLKTVDSQLTYFRKKMVSKKTYKKYWK